MITEEQALEIAKEAGMDSFRVWTDYGTRTFTRALNLTAAMALEEITEDMEFRDASIIKDDIIFMLKEYRQAAKGEMK